MAAFDHFPRFIECSPQVGLLIAQVKYRVIEESERGVHFPIWELPSLYGHSAIGRASQAIQVTASDRPGFTELFQDGNSIHIKWNG